MPDLLVEMLAVDLGQTEEVFPLADPDDHPDPGGEADDHRRRNEFDDRAEPGDAEQQQHDAGHHGGDLQAIDAVLGGDARQNHDERPSRPGDLQAAAAEQGYQHAGNDRRVDASLGLD